MKNYCPLPFGHLLSNTRGDYQICCEHRVPIEHRMNINQDHPDSWLNSEYIKQVRSSFEQEQQHPGCSQCWQHENAGRKSLRTRSINEYRILGLQNCQSSLVNAELQVGNLCNLTCVMCNPYSSSALLAENTKLGITSVKQQDIDWTDTAWQNIDWILNQGIRVLNIRGGEPLYNKKLLHLIENLPHDKASLILLHITTNATTWTDRWEKAFEKFRLVRFMFSLDAIGHRYEYIRFPAQWNTVEQNVQKIRTLPNAKCLVHAVIQNLNIESIGELISWCDNQDIYLELDRLYSPAYLQITNLPVEYKDRVCLYLKNLLSLPLKNHIRQFLKSCHAEIQQSTFNDQLWTEFQNQIGMRESLRGNNHRSIMEY